MSKIRIKIMSDDALVHMKKNITTITEKLQNNANNDWLEDEFPKPMFIEKKYEIEKFEILNNPNSKDKEIDFQNSISIYEKLKDLPRFILSDLRFWLWLQFDCFYEQTRTMMEIKGESTITDHWLHKQGTRRGLMFGVLSRCFFRVLLTVDNKQQNPYELTEWVVENPERFRNLSWRSFSSEEHLVRGILKGEKKAIAENSSKERNNIYTEIAKYVSFLGSVRLLDVISEEDISQKIYEKMLELL